MDNLFKSFKDLDIRVGTVIHAELFKEAINPSYKLKIDFGERISEAIPTSVEIIGVFVIAHSIMACGPPSILEATIYKSIQL